MNQEYNVIITGTSFRRTRLFARLLERVFSEQKIPMKTCKRNDEWTILLGDEYEIKFVPMANIQSPKSNGEA